MALAILVFLVTLFFMVFFSIYIRHFAGSDDDRRRRNPSLSSSSSSAHRQLIESMTSSSSVSTPRCKYDVFLSFRGEDTRRNFMSHLYQGLENRGIVTFLDDKRLEDGDSISEELMKAIEESQVAVIIFSKNYATSSWCLNELVKIMECKEKENGHMTVIPVFCNVDASHVRYQSQSFKEAFAKHESRYKDDAEGMQKVQRWRTALTAAADLKGYVFPSRGESDADCIKGIVDQISSKCNTSVSYLQDVVGLDTQLKKVESLLKMEINDIVRIVWIWGMGGIGKTTIAKKIFYELSSKFEVVCFLENIKENKHKMHSLQNILLSKLLGEKDNSVDDKEKGRSILSKRLQRKKVLIVLDDIDHIDQLDYLAKDLSWFGKGSRIIATTRDKCLIGENDAVHEVERVLDCDAIKLFNHYAFKEKVPNECFKDLTLEIVSRAKGHPLALKVLGSSLHRMDITEWESALARIKENSGEEITKNLKISYDGLEPEDKKIFLDIACFFRGIKKEKAMQVLESCYSGPKIGLRVLVNKSLVSISENNMIEMHDLIQDMGKSIVQMQKHLGERSRLWNVEDFKEVVDNNMGPMAVEAIWFTYSEKLCFSKDAMKNMQKLRILGIFLESENRQMLRLKFDPNNSNCLDGSIEYLPNNLRWFAWRPYPWKSLPENFNSRRLVNLDLRGSSLHYLWNETKLPQFPSLQRIDLSFSYSLKRLPDFKEMPNLEYLDLMECRSLEEVHPSLKDCKKLRKLNLDFCRKLKRFPYVNVESLESLNLGSSNLENFPEIHGRMKQGTAIKIIMSYSKIRELPLSFLDLQPHLIELHLNSMTNLVSLPSSICKSKDLVKLDVSRSKLKSLPEEIGDLENLEKLDANYTPISRLPSSIVRLNKLKRLSFEQYRSKDEVYFVFPQVNKGLLSLEVLDLSCCNIIDGGLPEDIGCLSSLKELHLRGNNFEYLPRSIAQLGALEYLNLSYCKRLTQLPEDIGSLSSLKELNLSYCNIIDGGLPEDIGSLSSLKHLNLEGNNFEHLPRSISKLGALQYLDLSDCKRLTQLPEFPQQLLKICADWSNDSICNSLFQNISSLQHAVCSSDSLSLRVFGSLVRDIPSWFDDQGMYPSVSVDLPENWYEPDKFLGFAVCSSGYFFIDCITAHLIPLCDDGMSSMTQQFALSKFPEFEEDDDLCNIYFLLVPLGGLWDASNANEKTPNDYGCIKLDLIGHLHDFGEIHDEQFGEEKKFGVCLLYKDKPELRTGIRKSRYEEEGSCSSSKKQRQLLQLFPTSPGL